jgi:hypothetical protein
MPLGVARFLQETGIKESDWHGRLWARWGDALQDAGFKPNQMQAAYSEDVLIERFVELIRELRHFPVRGELKLKARSDPTFPSHNAFARLGSKHKLAAKIQSYCKGRADYEDVANLCRAITVQPANHRESDDIGRELSADTAVSTKEGYVYLGLLKIGKEKRYKIGKAVLVERRTDQISLQFPEDLELIHAISTDDAYGIEDYWHRRFATQRTKGEWFSLSRQDVQGFKRRKFM